MEKNIKKTLVSLQGVAVGDALGERFYDPPRIVLPKIEKRIIPDGNWEYTDDTEMTISVVESLLKFNCINQDFLAKKFTERMTPYRGYDGKTYEILEYMKSGMKWRDVSYKTFRGKGSFGNGAAMRSTPIGAYFYNNIKSLINNARAAAEVTHSHPEGIAGAIAIALAASFACQVCHKKKYDKKSYYNYILDHMPDSTVRNNIVKLFHVSSKESVRDIVKVIGNGYDVSAQDTVPFVIWCSSLHLLDFENAFWYTLEGLGDRDTTCAMVCGIVSISSIKPIPMQWINKTEKLPQFKF